MDMMTVFGQHFQSALQTVGFSSGGSRHWRPPDPNSIDWVWTRRVLAGGLAADQGRNLGPSDADYAAVDEWLRAHGHNVGVADALQFSPTGAPVNLAGEPTGSTVASVSGGVLGGGEVTRQQIGAGFIVLGVAALALLLMWGR